jgi:hypothetical protein
MAFISLGEAVDRVLARLAEQREGKEAGGVEAARQAARVSRGGAAPALARGVQGSTVSAQPKKATQTMTGVARRR